MGSSTTKGSSAGGGLLGLAVLGAFFFSGASGLIHEIAWTRLLRLVMGNTTYSITTVLCAFMGGLALGGYLGGRFIERRRDPLRVFAVLELAIAVYCLALPHVIDALGPLYGFVHDHASSSFLVFGLIRFGLCGLLLLLPSAFMGATLPVLTRFFTQTTDRVGRPVGTLYAINTFGAVVGAATTGFLLIPALGVANTIYLACTLNTLVAVVALRMHRATRLAPESDRGEKDPAPAADPTWSSPRERAVLFGYAFSGFAALAYEVAWTRVLSLMIGSSVYAFSMMLSAFILGLAIGSLAFAGFADKVRHPLRTLALMQAAIGGSALLVLPLFERLPFFVTRLIAGSRDSFWALQATEFALVFAIMLVPTTLMGAAFPLAARIVARGGSGVASSVGTLYAFNTVGSILGSFAAGFVLIPGLGIQRTLLVAAGCNLIVGAAFGLLTRAGGPLRRLSLAGACVAAAAAGTLLPPWDPARMSFGPFIQAQRLSVEDARSTETLERYADQAEILYHKEGLATTVTVKQYPGSRTLLVNGKADASTGGDLSTQQLLAHVPLLLHPNPQRALVIGLASGITLGSAGRHPVRQLDCVEISPAVVEASRFFDEFNYRILDDPRVRVIEADGRNHLALMDGGYDVIISEPSNPWIAGVADLFTREFFELCALRLGEDGVACIWLEGYYLDDESFRSILATFLDVFEEATVWHPGGGDYLLVGSPGGLAIDEAVLASRIAHPAIGPDLARLGITSVPRFLGHLLTGTEGARRLAGDAPIHTDDNALLEFAAPRFLLRQEGKLELLESIEGFRDADITFLTARPAREADLEVIKERGTRVIQLHGHMFRAFLHRQQGRASVAEAEYRKAIEAQPSNPTAHMELAGILRARGAREEAIHEYREVDRLQPSNPQVLFALGQLLFETGEVGEAIGLYRRILGQQPDALEVLQSLAWILATQPADGLGDAEEATRLARRACELTGGRDAPSLGILSDAYAAAGRYSEASTAALQALQLAMAAGDEGLAGQMRERVQRYGSGGG